MCYNALIPCFLEELDICRIVFSHWKRSISHAMGGLYKAVLLEGLEVAFIVITFGTSAISNKALGIGSAAIGAAIAGLLVILIGVLVRTPLKQIPENTLKFIVGIMLTSFGTFWGGEGLGIQWPSSDVFLLVLVVLCLLASLILVAWLRQTKQQCLIQVVIP